MRTAQTTHGIDLLSDESILKMKLLVDRTPDKWLKFHLDGCVEKELYEIAAYIKVIAAERGVDVS